jgi:hypothetical protein
MKLKKILESSINERIEKFTFPWIKNEMIKILKHQIVDEEGLKFKSDDFSFHVAMAIPGTYYGDPLRTDFLGRYAYICGNLNNITVKYKKREIFSVRYPEVMVIGDSIANVNNQTAMITPARVDAGENLFDNKDTQTTRIGSVFNQKMIKFYQEFKTFERVESRRSYYNFYKVPENKIKKLKTFVDKDFYQELFIDFEDHVMGFDFIEGNKEPIKTTNDKKITNKSLKVGDYIFSKNDYEFNAKVVEIKNGKVTVEYGDNYDTGVVPLSIVKYDYATDDWSMPNWSV